ncbi:hypothetical protein NDU88_006151 [Pleurodeles waltl]|uniref:Uncharacterized protein n=1 Tax=Pleurodeles waltl TaxID=8319 RepID=A0AAV7NR44_PLEWA|nr:hypothetical protein NDU88_006151 [Pleurodeles waltl]
MTINRLKLGYGLLYAPGTYWHSKIAGAAPFAVGARACRQMPQPARELRPALQVAMASFMPPAPHGPAGPHGQLRLQLVLSRVGKLPSQQGNGVPGCRCSKIAWVAQVVVGAGVCRQTPQPARKWRPDMWPPLYPRLLLVQQDCTARSCGQLQPRLVLGHVSKHKEMASCSVGGYGLLYAPNYSWCNKIAQQDRVGISGRGWC